MSASSASSASSTALVDRFPATTDVLLGPGDDAAVVAAPDGRVVATTDLLVEGRHFRRDWSTRARDRPQGGGPEPRRRRRHGRAPHRAARRASAAPADLPADWALGLADGLAEECALVGATVVGGDVVRGEQVVVAVTALGDLEGRAPVTRAGAGDGDVVALAGRLGWAAAGLAVLGRGFRSPRVLADAHRVPSRRTPPVRRRRWPVPRR